MLQATYSRKYIRAVDRLFDEFRQKTAAMAERVGMKIYYLFHYIRWKERSRGSRTGSLRGGRLGQQARPLVVGCSTETGSDAERCSCAPGKWEADANAAV
jgi:hypothetical protein